MSALVQYHPSGLVAIPGTIRGEIEHYRNIPDELRRGWQPIYRPEAAALAEALQEEQARTAPADVIADWLMNLVNAVAANITPEQLSGRISVILNVLGDLPAYCWTPETFKLAAKAFKWFPTVAELNGLLEPIRDERQAMISLVLRMATPTASTIGIESKTPYPIPLPPPEQSSRHFDPKTVPPRAKEPVRTVEQQMASLGFNPDGKTPL